MRHSRSISRRQAPTLLHAVRLAENIGAPLNHFVSINFHHTGVMSGSESRVLRHILSQRFRKWYANNQKKNGLRTESYYAWCIENAAGRDGVVYPNAHLLVHLPDYLVPGFDNKLHCWLEEAGGVLEEGATHRRGAEEPHKAIKYMLKDAHKGYAKTAGIKQERASFGVVIGKRAGCSQNPGPAAEKKFKLAERQKQLAEIELAKKRRA